MTAAMRGFNMALNETNADNVADVYSALAATSAADVDEISTAMTKVASIAHSANMEFETTSALLTAIIETTRESAETAGTALKTVIARFSEVKELYDTNQLIGSDEEGEEIDVNKISKALRVAGINLNEYLTGSKGLDDIFLELSKKWDSLDNVTQRYIATMAAGSRQQSRFIAMMQNYARNTELVNTAQNAAGAATEQFNKTLESLDAKLNQLRTQWQSFTTTIFDQGAIKGVITVATKFLELVNKITGSS
jgi:TP901 family phage tail tape measure protein